MPGPSNGAAQIGSSAPDFELDDQHGQSVRLSSFRGEKNVVVLFYPWAFSGVCGGELQRIRDELADFQNDRVAILAISCDSVFSCRAYADREGFHFPLLSDFWPHGDIARLYGVFDDKAGAALRGTFIVDREGLVRWSVVNGIPDARDTDDYRRALADLG